MGAIVGFLSGFFGIGGGFLIVPGLVWATRMPLRDAVGASLVAVAAFGLTTSVSYALSGHVDPRLATLVVMGGLAGGLFGTRASAMIGARKEMLARVFSIFTILVGVYVSARGIVALYFRA
jgi:uncharacterized membrane protein YfcA